MVQFSEKIGPREEFTGPKLFRPEAYLANASSKLCKFIIFGGLFISGCVGVCHKLI